LTPLKFRLQYGNKAMLTTHSRSQFISRNFTDLSGRSFRLTFLVAIVDGELKGRLVSAQPLSHSSSHQLNGRVANTCPASANAFCLPIFASTQSPETEFIPAYTPIVSPYTELYFFTSQPTRAPSRN